MPKPNPNMSFIERISLRLTASVGTPVSIVVHTFMFVGIFSLMLFGIHFEQVMLILTTLVSLEAIYLSIFIQMTVNRNTASLEDVEEDIDTIHENVEDIQEDISGIDSDVDKINAGVAEISKDVDTIAEDVDDIQEHVEAIGDDVEELQEDDNEFESLEKNQIGTTATLALIQSQLQSIMKELETIRRTRDTK